MKLEWSEGFHIPEVVLKSLGVHLHLNQGMETHHNLTPIYMQLLHLKLQFPLLC